MNEKCQKCHRLNFSSYWAILWTIIRADRAFQWTCRCNCFVKGCCLFSKSERTGDFYSFFSSFVVCVRVTRLNRSSQLQIASFLFNGIFQGPFTYNTQFLCISQSVTNCILILLSERPVTESCCWSQTLIPILIHTTWCKVAIWSYMLLFSKF